MEDTGEGPITSQLDEHASGRSISGAIEGSRSTQALLDSLDSLDPTHSPKASLTRSRGSEIPALAASSMASSDEIGGLCEAGEDE
jgi:hypothetical protein